MKKVMVFFLLFSFFISIYPNEGSAELLKEKYKAVSIGQLSLAYRLIALSTSLSIAKAVDKDYIISLLDNVDATIINCKKIVAADNDKPDKMTKEILSSIDQLIDCSNNVKKYSASQSYENLTKVRKCIDECSVMVEKLTDNFNKKSDVKKKTEGGEKNE
jgi:hypothetical protein